jgi:glycosyltransferase involved in cell wall biosynthesis
LSQNSEDIQTALREKICRPEKIKYLGNGIDVRRFDRSRLDAQGLARLRQEFGLLEQHQVVGFVGRLVREKGLLELLTAAKLVLQRQPMTRFLLIGPVDDEKPDAFHPDTAREYGVAEACIFTGRRHDMPELFGLMNVFVLPSHREGFPRSPLEAAAMSLPSVVTDIRGCREAVESERNGLLVPLGDVPALANALLRLLENPALAQRMGETGRVMALEQFDEQLFFRTVKTEYARLLKARGITVPEQLLSLVEIAAN